MSKVFKAGNVKVDSSAKIFIDPANDELRGLAVRPTEGDTEDDAPMADKNEELRRTVIAEAKREAENIRRQARVEADETTAGARRDAGELLERARAEADEIYETSKSEGYDMGYADGAEATDAMRNEAEDVLREARKQRGAMLDNIEEEMVGVITATLQKLIGAAADIDPRVIMCLIKQGFDDATIIGDVRVHVSKDDYDGVRAHKNDIMTMTKGTEVEIIKNLSLNKADCIIETPYGNIDCSLEQQFNELKRNLRFIYEEAKTGA